MSTHLPEQHRHRSRKRPQFTLTTPMFPEGLVSLALLILIVGCAGYSVQQADWARIVLPVPVVALAAALFGSVLAKIRVLDSLAHLASIMTGIGFSFVLVATRASELAGSPRDRIKPLAELAFGWYMGRQKIDEDQTYLVSILVGIIVWLVGYLSAWTLFRRGWILIALLLPGFLILVNLGYAPDPDTRFLLAYGLLCIPLIARVHLSEREREWSRQQLVGPRALSTRFLLFGAIVAIIASTIGWQSPASLSQRTFQPVVGEISTQVLDAQDQAAEWMRRKSGTRPIGGKNAGSFSSFDGSFSVGGPLELSDTPQAVVFADNAPYLAAQRFDSYSGRGWSSTSGQTFDSNGPDGRQYSPEMTFGAGQQVALSPDVSAGRAPSTVIVTPLGPSSDRLFTVDTYLTADIEASVSMSWQQLDDVSFDLANGPTPGLPTDLQRIAGLLAGADLRGETGEGGPTATDVAIQREIEKERQQLIARFLTVSWTADASGSIETLRVSGQIPEYDDVDAVFGRSPVETGTPYKVTGSNSSASHQRLGEAGTEYPVWIRERYLPLPESVTPRTIEFTSQLTAGAGNPAEAARVIEQYLRTTIVYDETVPAPPDDADLVDYLLFERQRGYCEYYASAMAVMLRTVGVPARVVVGFYPGEYDQEQGGFLYRQKNAHAWVEVFFPDYGWIAFEPTASRPPMATDDTELRDAVQTTPMPTPLDSAMQGLSTPIANPENPQGAAPLPQVTSENDGNGSMWMWATIFGAVTSIGIAGLAWLLWSMTLRGAPPPSAMYIRLRRLGRFFGVTSSPTETPREYAESFINAVPLSREHVTRIVHVYELDQFGPEPADNRLVSLATNAWLSIRRQVPSLILRRRIGQKPR